MRTQLIKKLEQMVHIHGLTYVAYHLGQKDTQTIKKWIKRASIPEVRLEAVRNLINKEKLNATGNDREV